MLGFRHRSVRRALIGYAEVWCALCSVLAKKPAAKHQASTKKTKTPSTRSHDHQQLTQQPGTHGKTSG